MDYDTIKISNCCRARVSEMETDNGEGEKYECNNCHRECEFSEVCEHCLGEGTVSTMEQVYSNEPHYAPTGTRKCICQINLDEYDNEDY